MQNDAYATNVVGATSSWSGVLRIGVALAVTVLLAGGGVAPYQGTLVYPTLGVAALYGVALVFLPASTPPRREALARVVLDAALVSGLVAGTGGGASVFFALYLVAALELVRVGIPARAVAGGAVLVGGFLATAVAVSGFGALAVPGVLWRTTLLLLFCVLAGVLGFRFGGLLARIERVSAELDTSTERAEKAEGIVSSLGLALSVSSAEGTLRWAAEAARQASGGSYAHAAALDGHQHYTVCSGEADVYPTWWHPEIQRLLLWSCREERSVWGEEVHGIERLLAVPIGPVEGEYWGALIVGGHAIGEAEERALRLIAGVAASALGGVREAPAGRDQISGLPNRASLERVLAREMAQGRTLTLVVADVSRLRLRGVEARGPGAGDAVLSAVGARLAESRHRAFRWGRDEFAVILNGNGDSRARRTAVAIQQLLWNEAGGEGALEVAVGYAFSQVDERDTERIMQTSYRVLAKAREEQAGGIAGPQALTDSDEDMAVVDTVRAIAETLEHRDPYIKGHLETVARISRAVGARISLPEPELAALVTGALLHDVGKIGIPDRILQKTGRLTSEEYETIKRHPLLGARMISPVKELATAVPVVRHHHERYDGRGYPDGLRGSEIPLIARIVAVVDAFDAMVRGRPYENAIPHDMAVEEIKSNAGTQFDPHIVHALLEVLEEERPADSAGQAY